MSLEFFLLIIIACVSTDLGGYIFGKLFKGPKLTKISPNKTYSGMIGGYFLSLIFLSFFMWLTDQTTSVEWFIITILILLLGSHISGILFFRLIYTIIIVLLMNIFLKTNLFHVRYLCFYHI